MIGVVVQELKSIDDKLKLYDINITSTSDIATIDQNTKEKVKKTLSSKIKALSD